MGRPAPLFAGLFAGVILLFTPLAVAATGPARFLIRSWQSEDGLPGNVVRSIAQAADGYLWVATAEGTVRFDGARFTGFDLEPDASLARLPPRQLFPMAGGDVWITTARGGLLRWSAGRLTAIWKEIPDKPPITQVITAPAGEVLIARGDELWRFDRSSAVKQVERTPSFDALLKAGMEAASHHGRGSTSAVPGSNPLELVDSRGRVWTATPLSGLSVGTNGRNEQVALPALEPGSRINEIHEDREGNIWAATGDSGLVQIRERRVDVLTMADGLRDKTAVVVLEDASGGLWVGGGRGGLDYFHDGAVSHHPVGDTRATRPVAALFQDHTGTIWAATRDGSVFRREEGVFHPFLNVANGITKVRAIAEDHEGRIWFGGVQGLAAWHQDALHRFTPQEGFDSADVTTLAVDPSGTLWIGTSAGKVWSWRKGRFESQPQDHSITPRAISAILPDPDGSIWVTTLGAGLWHLHKGHRTRFLTAEGLPDLRLTTVLQDGVDHLWLGALTGIFRVSKRELHAVETHEIPAASWLKLNRSDGLVSSECSGGSHPAGCSGRDGRLWFPMVRGVASISPAELPVDQLVPPVVIESVQANSKTFSGRAPLRIGPGRAHLAFRYTALTFAAPEKAEFRIQLEGLENEWRAGTPDRTAVYEAVPPGHYRFRVQAANGDGVWNRDGATVALQVLPHFWETNLFRALVLCAAVALALGAGWAVARQRMRRRLIRLQLQNARQAERVRIARDLHDDLGASLTEISMLAALAVEDVDSTAAARQPLTQIASKAHSLVGALDEIVWAVNPRQDTIASLVDYLAAFAAEFLAAGGIALRLDVPRGLPDLPLDSERRHALFLAIREALNNAARHAACSEVSFRVRLSATELEIVLRDNGHGFQPSAAPQGNGLGNICDRLTSLGGTCRIESQPGAGTAVFLTLPLPSAIPA